MPLTQCSPLDEAYTNPLTGHVEVSPLPRLDPTAFRGSYVAWGNNSLYRDDELNVPVYYRNFDKLPLPSPEF